METGRRGCFGDFLKVVIALVILSAVGYVGYKTYQKIPVITFVSDLSQAASELDMKKLSDCFTPDSEARKAFSIANKIEDIPILGYLAESAINLIASGYDFQVDYSDIRITVNGNTGKAVIGVIDRKNNDEKIYLTYALRQIDKRWYTTKLPTVQSASEADLLYGNTLRGYAERASDYIALAFFSARRGA